MESHIYPLNIEEPSPLNPKSKKKKPTFKEWAKERKKMVIFVCTVAVLALATVTIYATGLSDKMLGLTYDEYGEEIVIFTDQEGTKETKYAYHLQYSQKTKEIKEEDMATKNKTLVLLVNTGAKPVYIKARLISDSGTIETIETIDKGVLNASISMHINSLDFDKFGTLAPGDYTLSVKVFSKKSNMNADPKKETYLGIINFPFTITETTSPPPPPKTLAFTLTATPSIQTAGIESSFLVNATGGTPPYDFFINYGDNLYNYYNKVGTSSLTIKHTYSKAGTYKVLAKVTDSSSKIENKSIEKYVITAPSSAEIPTFTLVASPKSAGETGKGSYFFVKATGGTPPYKFHIDYDDNNVDNATGNEAGQYTFKHAYSKAGDYGITAKVTDDLGKTENTSIPKYVITNALQNAEITYETKTEQLDYIANKDIKQEIVVKNTAVTLSLTATLASPQTINTKITFKLEATANASPYNFKINYGDDGSGDIKKGSTSNTVTFEHAYTKAGTYTVDAGVTSTLNVNDPAHEEITYQITETKTEAVVPPPPAETKKQCDNGKDDDGDDKYDYKGIIGKVKDPGCESKDDDSEESDKVVTPPPSNNTPEPPLAAKETKCDDGKDNDKDGKIDYEDSDCKAPKDASIKITEVGVTSQKLNPALNAVKIYYKLSDSANVKVEIKNAKGDVTIPLFEGKQTKQVGNFSVWWEGTLDNKPNGQKAPDGTYTYKISAEHLKYPSVKDSKEGTITVDSTYNPGGLDFEDINNANLVGGTTQGQGTGTGTGTGTGQTPSTPSQNQATVAIQSATTGSTAGTGPGVVIYFLFPLFAYAYKKIKY